MVSENIGKVVSIEEITNSDTDKWFTLVRLRTDKNGSIVSGEIRYEDDSEALASRHNSVLERERLLEDSIVIGGGGTVKDLAGVLIR